MSEIAAKPQTHMDVAKAMRRVFSGTFGAGVATTEDIDGS